jgi:Parvulin-like peptidyl-prolyl isomerase
LARKQKNFCTRISPVFRVVSKSSKYIISFLLLAGGMPSYLLPVALRAEVMLDRIVAIVNDDVIMQSELDARLRAFRNQLEQQKTEPPPAEIMLKQVLEALVLNKLQLQLAAGTGIVVDDETLNQTISKIAEQNKVTLTQFREILERDGYSYEQFREDIRNEITISRLKQRHVDNRITVTDGEIDNFLATEQHQGGLETEYRLSHILIAVPESATAEEKEQAKLVAEKILEDLANGEDFASLAASLSTGPQAQEGGDLGWRKASDIPSLFAEQVAAMKEGEVSKFIESPSGFHIIKLTGLRSADKFMVTQTNARHILLKTNELQSDEDISNKLKQLKTRIEGGDNFAELAKSHSEDPASAVNGGDLGWVNPGEMVPEFEQVMKKLKPGEISEPFKTDFGWHIVQVMDRREHDSSEDRKRNKARETIRQRKTEEAQQNWLRQMRDEAYVEYRLDEH